MESPKDSFRKITNKIIKENEAGVYRKAKRCSCTSLSSSMAYKAVALEANQQPEISPRDMLKINMSGRSIKDVEEIMTIVSPRLNRKTSQNTECSRDIIDYESNINHQLNNLRSPTTDANTMLTSRIAKKNSNKNLDEDIKRKYNTI